MTQFGSDPNWRLLRGPGTGVILKVTPVVVPPTPLFAFYAFSIRRPRGLPNVDDHRVEQCRPSARVA